MTTPTNRRDERATTADRNFASRHATPLRKAAKQHARRFPACEKIRPYRTETAARRGTLAERLVQRGPHKPSRIVYVSGSPEERDTPAYAMPATALIFAHTSASQF